MFGLEPPSKRPRLEQHYASHSQSQCFDDTQPPSTQPTAELQQETGTKAATENDDDAQERQSHAPNPDQTYTSPRPQTQTPAPAPEPLTGPSPSTASLNGSWYQDGFSQDPGFLASQEELRAILFTLANSAAPTRASSPELGKTSTTTSPVVYQYQQPQYSRDQRRRSERDVIPQSPLSSRRRIEYLKNYVAEIAPWLDMFDSHCTFAQQIPTLSHSFPALLYAILAISARQMERKSGSGTQDWYDSLELYQEAIRLLSPLLQVRDPKIVAACVLLCCLEMMSARAQDWHRHLEGCAALFEASGIHGFCGGLLQAVFWCYARMDLCGALISDGTRTTTLHPSKWLPMGCHEEDAYRLFKEARSPDMHANYAVYLSVKATELVSNRTKFVELGEDNGCTTDVFNIRWSTLWNDLQTWLADRPAELLPVQTIARKPFPHILFVHWAAISSNQLYHTACILLLKMMPRGLRLPRSPTLSLLWHARRICGISTSNKHQGCLNNAIQPLWIAGRLFSHASEHEQIVKVIRDIEAETGWGAVWRIRDLEVAWGYSTRRETSSHFQGGQQHFASTPMEHQHVAVG
ncbi:fungal-specific transcription factor domain-containing protein [Aspergillus keveii]|uniref:Fungal-specific transcription factor domain-containing protein n=1 Tax=Aspergillus keveii TaxID=714993 RepID=A0ABR4GPD0_9EURO